jgi:hypothetical protein
VELRREKIGAVLTLEEEEKGGHSNAGPIFSKMNDSIGSFQFSPGS